MLSARKPRFHNMILSENVMETLQQDINGFSEVAEILKNLTGIHLIQNEKNLFLMAGRLNKVFRKLQITSYAEYIELLKSGKQEYLTELVSAMTTNTTEFFREADHFDLLKMVAREILLRKGHDNELRVWCSASSTGQEPYTIAMVLEEARSSLPPFKLKLLATDIDNDVLQRASNGVYTQREIESVPPLYRQKYFNSQPDDDQQTLYQANADLRSSIRFAQFNLLTDTYPFKFPFDIIFCRNVLIYFDRPTSAGIISKFAGALGKDSYLFLGHAETGTMQNPNLKSAGPALYQRKT